MPIVYDGVDVNAGDQGGGNGGLFHGIKFWISHRVPMRETFVKLVQNNGGEIVRLEKFSDMMIADHARRGAGAPPPGSYSWKWIENSVNNGALEDKDAYLIGRSVDSSRQAGAAEPAKSSRTPFTEKDDLILTKWILNKGTSSGMNATQGNAIYQELERRHPHHTWQSWRSRWVKHLRDRTGGMAQYERGETPSPPPRPALRREILDEPKLSISVALPSTRELRESPEPAPSEPLVRQRRVPFTPEEDDMLIAYVRQANLEGKAIKGNEIYKEFAIQHNSHTWQSWRDRWVKHLCHIPAEHADVPGPPDPKSSPGDSQLKSIAMAARALFRESSPVEPAASGAHVAETTQQSNLKSDDERLRAQSQQRMERIAAKLLQRTWRGYAVRRDYALLMAALVPLQSVTRGYLLRSGEARVVSLQAIMRGHLVRVKIVEGFPEVISSVNRGNEAEDTIQVITEDTPAVDEDNELENMTQDLSQAKRAVTHGNRVENMIQKSPEEKPAVDGHDRDENMDQELAEPGSVVHQDDQNDMAEDIEDPDTTTIAMTQPADAEKSRFYKDLRDYAEVSECMVDMHPVIYKRAIDLWDLFRAATQVDNHSENRDWQRIAETLGFGEDVLPYAAQQLQMFFNHNLADFEEAIQAYDSADVVVEGFEEQAPGDNRSEASSASLPDQDMISHSGRSLIRQQSPTVQSSPPITRYKRPRQYEELITSDLSYPPSGLKKRRRLDSGSVIPSTPEEKLGLSGTNRTTHKVHEESSPLKYRMDVAQGRIVANAYKNSPIGMREGIRDAEAAANTRAQSPLRTRVSGQRNNANDEQNVRSSIEDDEASPLRQRQARVGHKEGQQPLASKDLTHTRQDRGRLPSTSTLQHLASGGHDSIVVASQSPSTFSSRVAAQVKATKRILPSQYVQKPVSIAASATPVVAPKPNGSAYTHPRNGMDGMAYSTAVPRKATVNGQSGHSRPSSILTPTPSMPRSMSRAAASPAAQGYRLGEAGRSSNANSAKLDLDYVSDIYTHFQRLGYAESDIVVASDDASCQPHLMSVVLESLAKGRDIPQNEPGIWTKADKEEMNMIRNYQRRIEKGKDIEGPGMNDRARVRIWQARNRLEAKHGESGLERRNQFLDTMQR